MFQIARVLSAQLCVAEGEKAPERQGVPRYLLIAAGAALSVVLIGSCPALAQGIEDINSDTQVDLNSNATIQANATQSLAVLQTNLNSTLQIDLNTADALAVAIINNLDITTVNPGEIGINAQSLATATVTQENSTEQSNTNDFSQSNPVGLLQLQFVAQLNENETTGFVNNAAFADTVSVDNVADITAEGAGINALSRAVAVVTVTNSTTQTNHNSLTGDAPDLEQVQLLLQANENETAIVVFNQALSADVSVSNIGATNAGQDGINAASVATATTTISNASSQTNSNALIGTGDEVEQFQLIGQANLNLDLVAAGSGAISGNVTVENSGATSAGGIGINALSSATASTALSQQANQANTNSMTAGGQEEGNDPSIALQGQLVGQLNLNVQGGLAEADAYAGNVTVAQEGVVSSGGDGIAATSSAVAAAGLNQTATQSNSNSASATLERPDDSTTTSALPLIDIDALALQGQLIGQLNFNEQGGEAIATAVSSYVSVESEQDPSGGNGITATSSAVATAGLNQTATQSNSNSADITLPAAPVVTLPENEEYVDIRIPGLEIAAQLEGVLQVNVNEQFGLAFATAESDFVLVDQSGTLKAGGDGITATSSAVAAAGLNQTATQSNTDTKTIDRAENPPLEEDQIEIPPTAISAQLEAVLQINASEQFGLVAAEAASGPVDVYKADGLEAVGNGISAISSAVATAGLNQTATQSNTNSVDATGAVILQGQLVGQLNANGQSGAAIASAFSDYVNVEQSGVLKAGGDGITATSSAVAAAGLNQTASQSNSNSTTATLERPDDFFVVTTLEAVRLPRIDIDALALQGQLVGQLNFNEQGGEAIATAVSSYVQVESGEDPSGGNGIIATSSAVATAGLNQTATQSNSNSADITLAAVPVVTLPENNGPVFIPIPGLEIAAQLEGVLQVNVNGQFGLAFATAELDFVLVDQSGTLKAGGDGITATSSAVAAAGLNQTATQSNTDTKTIDRAENPPLEEDQIEITPTAISAQLEAVLQINASEQFGLVDATAASGPVDVYKADGLEAVGNGISAISSAVATAGLNQTATQSNTNSVDATGAVILQGQLVGQLNANGQSGAAIASAFSDYVNVEQSGVLKAGGDGITATSSAVAAAGLNQTASQSNSNSTTATLERPDDFGFAADARLVEFIDIDALALQGQLVGQLNFNEQGGEAIATAVSSYVSVESEQDPSGGNGITATSSAVATAGLNQTATQSNSNSADITLAAVPVVTLPENNGPVFIPIPGLEIAAQLEGVLQVNVNEQFGLAFATAESDSVLVDQSGTLKAGGDGITATSSAVAAAGLNQTATQSNTDTKTIDRAENPPLEEDQIEIPPTAISAQLEAVLQINASEQFGLADAAAASGPVEVDSRDDIGAGGNGITAISSAVATAGLNQTATQSNTNSVDATGAVILQGQLAGQLNLNIQDGAAIATASSDYVEVDQSGVLTAGGDGITATSSAVAAAGINQTATQSNSNSAEAALVEGTIVPSIPLLDAPTEADVSLARLPILGGVIGAQVQLVGQANLSAQIGYADAEATSNYVDVDSFEDPAGGNGLTATSSAVATAGLTQSVTQSNSNNASITLPAFEVVDEELDEEAELGQIVFFDPQFALQLEGVLQANASLQAGSASAAAFSDAVDVDQSGLLQAGGDALTATSSAVAVANLSQEASQSNIDTKTIDRAEGVTPEEDQTQIVTPTGAVQIEAVGQANVNLQFGEASAYANSGPVDVHTQNTIDAGGNGISAESNAVAVATLNQSVEQSNDNSADATGGTLDIGSGATDAAVVDGTGVFQLQLVGQLNVNLQEGEARASAFADEVDLYQGGALSSGGNGVTAASSAVAVAALGQAASQSNSNSGTATLEASPTEFTPVFVPQLVIQANANIQDGDAYADATSSDVKVYTNQDPSGGDGVTATSSAVATSALGQTTSQNNNNSVLVTGPAEGSISLRDSQPLIVQANLNIQEGEAISFASSGDVDLTKYGDVSAGGQGIGAVSASVAVAAITQSVDQSNSNLQSANADTGRIGQQQGAVVQANVSGLDLDRLEREIPGQEAFALAAAESGAVEVWNTGGVSAATGDGINAASTAVAVSPIIQTANQDNVNRQSATLGNPEAEDQLIDQSQRLVIQANTNVQDGVSISAAASGPVEVWNEGDITFAVGAGIRAVSSAVAVAGVAQNATQSNNNSQDATIRGAGTVFQTQGLTVQLNLNEQEGVAVALATSDDVEVRSKGFIDPGTGIYAHSDSVANASVEQNATQSNSNTANSTLGIDGTVIIARRAPTGQLNESEQEGIAVAVSTSGEVSVEQTGNIYAGGNGIDAASTALATASVDQSVSQSNQNTANVTAGDETVIIPIPARQFNDAEQEGIAVALALANDVNVTQDGEIWVGGDGIKAISNATADATVTQAASQQNSNEDGLFSELTQEATTVAIAVAGQVSIDSWSEEINTGGDGIVGISSATANAIGGNTPLEIPGVAYEGYDEYAATGYQPDDWAPIPFEPDAFAYAEADKVDVDFTGNIYADGNGIVAISKATAYAEADAGTGDAAAIAISEDVDVTVSGNVKARKSGIVAASFADAEAVGGGDTYTKERQGNVTVAVKGGTVSGGNGYYGIVVLGGDHNVITIDKGGAVTSQSRHAIFGGDEDEKVENYGLVDGNVDLGLGNNAFNNYAAGRFYSGSLINLNGGLLLNAGVLSPGGPGVIQASELNGSLVQTNDGNYAVDVELKKPSADFVHATGSAALDGRVDPTIIANPASGKHKVTILSADGGVTDNGISVGDTALVDYSLRFPNPNDVVLKVDVDFAPKGLGKEGNLVGSYLNKVFKNGGPNKLEGFGQTLVGLQTVGDVSNAYNQLTGANAAALGVSELYSQERFSEDQMSCPVRDGGAWAFIDENQCVYARVRYRNLQQDANAGTSGSDEDAIGVMGGAQWAWNGPWHAGVAVGYENSDLTTNSPSISSDGDRFRVGGSVKYIAGPWLVGGAVTGNWSNYDSTRQISFPGFSTIATSEQDFSNIGGQFRVAYQLNAGGSWYAKPMVDLMVTNVDMDGFGERGGVAALKVAGYDETVFSATPAIEVGNQWATAGGTLVRPFVRGGVSFYNDADFPIAAGFAAAPGVAPFTTAGEIDDVLGNVSAGVQILGVAGSVLSFSYDGSFGDTIVEHSASAKASVRF